MVMDNVEAFLMHLSPGVVNNFPRAMGAYNLCPYAQKNPRVLFKKSRGATPGILVSRLNKRR